MYAVIIFTYLIKYVIISSTYQYFIINQKLTYNTVKKHKHFKKKIDNAEKVISYFCFWPCNCLLSIEITVTFKLYPVRTTTLKKSNNYKSLNDTNMPVIWTIVYVKKKCKDSNCKIQFQLIIHVEYILRYKQDSIKSNATKKHWLCKLYDIVHTRIRANYIVK